MATAVLVAAVVACTPPSSITGVITDDHGAMVVGARVIAHPAGGSATTEVTTDSTGTYVLASLAPGQYLIEVVPDATHLTTWYPAPASSPGAPILVTEPLVVTSDAVTTANVVIPTAPPPPPLSAVRLGSPTNAFGNQISSADCPQSQPSTTGPCGPQPMIWAAINGPYQLFPNGDPYATKCAGATGTTSGQSSKAACDGGGTPANPLYRPTGYAYAVDVAPADVGKPLTVEGYDLTSTWRQQGIGVNSSVTVHGVANTTVPNDCRSDQAPFTAAPYTTTATGWSMLQCQTGDSAGTWDPPSGGNGSPHDINELNMAASLYQNDGSDATVSYGALQPSSTGGDCQLLVPAGIDASATGYKNAWKTICTFTPRAAGIFPLRIQSSGIPGVTDNGDAFNAFALRVSGGSATGLRPLADISTWTNVPGGDGNRYLADIGSDHAGQTLSVDLFDPGDGSGSSQFTVQLLAPPGGAPATVPTGTGTTVGCSYNATPNTSPGGPTPDASSTCTVVTKPSTQTNGGIYNGTWLRLQLVLPASYSCSTDCWWTLRSDLGSGGLIGDRTVVSVHVG